MSANNFDELIYGKEFADRKKKFESELLNIEKKHHQWFSDREDIITNEKPDRLHNHYIMKFDSRHTQFAILKDSDLPDYIGQECIDAFNTAFQPD